MNSDVGTAQARMDRMYRHQRRIYDITRRYYLLGRKRLLDDLAPPVNGTVLEVGCGTAYNLVAAARRYPAARLYGLDISTEMLATARQSVVRHSLEHRISLAVGDATHFVASALFDVAMFDRVFTSYTLSMIPGWQGVLEQMARHIAPGGTMHVVDFGDCAGLPAIAKFGLYTWLNTFDVEPRQELHAALRDLSSTHRFNVAFTPLYRGYAQYATLSGDRFSTPRSVGG